MPPGMPLIDASVVAAILYTPKVCGSGTPASTQAGSDPNVTIDATVSGIGGAWVAPETYPVVLGWGVELNAPGQT